MRVIKGESPKCQSDSWYLAKPLIPQALEMAIYMCIGITWKGSDRGCEGGLIVIPTLSHHFEYWVNESVGPIGGYSNNPLGQAPNYTITNKLVKKKKAFKPS